jgi:hypothetical protein
MKKAGEQTWYVSWKLSVAGWSDSFSPSEEYRKG